MKSLERKIKTEQLVERLHAFGHKLKMEAYHSSDLPFSQMALLHLIGEHEGIGIKEIARLLGVTSSAATQLVDHLVHKDYLTREPDLVDRRALRIKLSPGGLREMHALKHSVLDDMVALFAALNDEELDTYVFLNKKVLDSIMAK